MDSHEWNKIAGGVLGTVLFVLVVRIVSGAVFEKEEPAKPGYIVPGVVEEASTTSAAPVEEAMPDWGTVLPAADIAKGHDISHKCEQCHDLSKGGPNKIGPNLWGVIARARASHPGFDYSAAMKAKGGNWTFDEVFKFVKSPQAYIEGTKMSFAGLASAQDRINLIAYLRQDSDSPVPVPAPNPKAAAPTAPTPAAGGTAPAAPTGATPAPVTPGAPASTPAATPQGGPTKPATAPATPPKKS